MRSRLLVWLFLGGVCAAQFTGAGQVFGSGTITRPTPPTLQSILVTPSSPTIANGASQQFTATGVYSDGSFQNVTGAPTVWSSADITVATIGNTTPVQQVNCVATGGPIVITATVGLVSGTATITCTGAPPPTLVSIALTPSSFSTANGGSVPYTALGTYSDSSTADVTTTATWHSSNVGVATIGTLTSSQQVMCGNPGSGTSNITANVGAVTSPISVLMCVAPGSCGPPAYACSPTNTSTINPPPVPPQVGGNTCISGSLVTCGNKLGANTVVSAGASYNSNPIVRLTDSAFSNASNAISSGGGDENRWNTNSTFLSIRVANSGADKFYSFNPSTMQGSRLYLSSISSGLGFAGDSAWSQINPNLVYVFPINSSLVQTLNVSNCVTLPSCGSATPPSPATVFDFKSGVNCLGSSFTVTWSQLGQIGGGDATIAEAFGNSGGQGGAGARYAAVYVPGKGCAVLNTVTGVVTADQPFNGGSGLTCSGTGCTGTVAGWTGFFGASGFVLHNVHINDGGGDWMQVVPCQGSIGCGVVCTGPNCLSFFWQVGTTHIVIPQNNLGGHQTAGFTTSVNIFNGKFTGRQFTSANTIVTYSPQALAGQVQQHNGWYNVVAGDTYSFLATTFTPGANLPSYSGPWFNEVIGVTPHTNATTFRFSPTFNSNLSNAFAVQQAIGSVSQDGRFFAWSSDWLGTLGAENGATTCVLAGPQGGTNCRGDVFVVKLQ